MVLLVERLDDRRADLARADDEDVHGAQGYSAGAAANRGRSSIVIACAPPLSSAAAVSLGALIGIACAADASTAGGEQASFRPRVVVRSVSEPVHVTAPRSEPGRLYVVEQGGVIRVVDRGRLRATPFLDIRSKVTNSGEQGLLSVAFHPQYKQNRLFYVQYTDRDGDTQLVEYRSNGTRATPGHRAAALLQPRPVREPQRRPARLRPERAPLLHDGRRRRRRRPGEPLAEHALAVREAALAERRDEGRPDRGARTPQRLAVLVRPCERRPLHRRRRPGRDRGDRLHARRRAPGSRTTAGTSTRATRSSRTSLQARASSSSRSPSTRTTTAARSQAASSTAARTPRCEAATSTATTAAGSSGASKVADGKATSAAPRELQDPGADVLRRGCRRRALRHLARRRRLPPHAVARVAK